MGEVQARIEEHSGLLKTGMQGKAKVSTDRVALGVAIFRKPVRYLWNKLWPLLP